MFYLDSFQTITQFIGPEDHTLDKIQRTLMSGNLDVLKQYDVPTNLNVNCYCIHVIYTLLNGAILYFYLK